MDLKWRATNLIPITAPLFEAAPYSSLLLSSTLHITFWNISMDSGSILLICMAGFYLFNCVQELILIVVVEAVLFEDIDYLFKI